MQFEVKYLPEQEGVPPKGRKITTPWVKYWDDCEYGFERYEGNLDRPGVEHRPVWLFEIRQRQSLVEKQPENNVFIQFDNPSLDRVWHLLRHQCNSFEEYCEWLEESVIYIAADGELIWENLPYKKAQDKLHEEAEAGTEDDGDVLDELFGV